MKKISTLVPKVKIIRYGMITLFLGLFLACNLERPARIQSQVTTIQSPEQEAVVTYGGDMSLTIPANSVAGGTHVSIGEVKGTKPYEYSGIQTLGVYEIKIGGQTSFDQPLQIKIKYDASKLQKDIAPADQLVVAYLDESARDWIETDFSVDEADTSITIFTNHLSLWGLFGLDSDTVVSTAPHFRIYFNEKLNAPMLGSKPSGAGLMYDFVANVRSALVDAYTRYDAPKGGSGTGFKQPDMTNVYIDDWGTDKTAEWGWFSKSIEIPVTYSSLDELNQDSAHELFHAIQNQYAGVPTMLANRWWMEATADYAAGKIGTTNGLQTTMGLDFIKKPLDDGDEKHMYRVSHFLDYLNQQGIDFKDLFEASMYGAGNSLGAMEGYVSSQGMKLSDLYIDFASSFIFSNSLKREALPNNTPMDLVDTSAEFNRASTRGSLLLMTPAHYATRLGAFKITDDPSVHYTVYLSALEATDFMRVRYFISSPTDGTIFQSADLISGQSEKAEIQGGAVIYFMVTNVGEYPGQVNVTIEQSTGMYSFNNERSAKIYNGFFTADVTLTVESTVPFEVGREVVAPNGEMMAIDLKLTKAPGESGATINVTAKVENVVITDQAAHLNLTASLGKTEWVLPGGSSVTGGTASYTLASDAARPVTLSFNAYIDTISSESGTIPFGSGLLYSVTIAP